MTKYIESPFLKENLPLRNNEQVLPWPYWEERNPWPQLLRIAMC